jgi:hypothetical protein
MSREHPLERISSGLQATTVLVQQLAAEVHDNSLALGSVTADIRNLKENVTILNKIIKDGNGDSVLTRLSVTEATLERMQKDLEGVAKSLSDLARQRQEASVEEARLAITKRGQKLAFWAPISAAVIAMISAIVAIFLKK